jgi:hypothetical protein
MDRSYKRISGDEVLTIYKRITSDKSNEHKEHKEESKANHIFKGIKGMKGNFIRIGPDP